MRVLSDNQENAVLSRRRVDVIICLVQSLPRDISRLLVNFNNYFESDPGPPVSGKLSPLLLMAALGGSRLAASVTATNTGHAEGAPRGLPRPDAIAQNSRSRCRDVRRGRGRGGRDGIERVARPWRSDIRSDRHSRRRRRGPRRGPFISHLRYPMNAGASLHRT